MNPQPTKFGQYDLLMKDTPILHPISSSFKRNMTEFEKRPVICVEENTIKPWEERTLRKIKKNRSDSFSVPEYNKYQEGMESLNSDITENVYPGQFKSANSTISDYQSCVGDLET